MIGAIICWLKKGHNWSDWAGLKYTDSRTWHWTRFCQRCGKINSTLEEPEVTNQELSNLAHTVLQNIGDKEI